MKVTTFTREALRCRRERKRLLTLGYEEVGEGGGRLWELHRGARIGFEIVGVVIGPERRSVFIKVEPTVARLVFDAFPKYTAA